MTLAYWMVLIAGLLPYLLVLYAKATPAFLKGDYNKNPREYAAAIKGPRQRAYWAHQNGFEVFPAFAAAVIIATLAGVAQDHIDQLAVAFVASRVLHALLYITDQDKLRTVVFIGGQAAVVGMFVLAAT